MALASRVGSQRNRVDIHEDLVITEAGSEPVVQAAGQAAGLCRR
jgi:hypothetical protein